MISINTPSACESIFGAPISVYTREQALDDGVLIDATIGDFGEVTKQHFRRRHVAMTAAVFELIRKAVENPKHCNDYKGVWHDVCHMSQVCCKRISPSTRLFIVIITGAGRRRKHILKSVAHVDEKGAPCLTFMLPNED